MSEITLYCEETPDLKLGPGVSQRVRTTWDEQRDTPPLEPGDVIEFHSGFATFDSKEFPLWEVWVKASGTPPIRIVSSAAGEATTAAEAAAECPICGRSFKTDFALNGHLRSHAPAGTTTTNRRAS